MIKPLTSLRFLFAILVFLSHMWFLESESPFVSGIHNYFFKEGFIGVSFFFMLSGFVLSYSYRDKLLNGNMGYAQFWKARFARIYPLHILTLLISIPLMLNQNAVTFINKLLLNVMLLQSFVPSDGFYLTFNAVAWSLSDEMFFYLCFPILLLLLTKKSYRWIAILAYVIIVPIGIMLTRDVFHHALFYVNPIARTADFIIGMLMYRLYAKRKHIEFLNDRLFASMAEVFVIGLLFAFVYFHEYVPLGYRYSLYYALPMFSLIYVFSYSNGVISKILSHKTIVFLGDTSFSFYMLHIMAFRYYIELQKVVPWLPSSYGGIAIVFTVSLVGSIVTYKYFEMPMNRLVKKLLNTNPSIWLKNLPMNVALKKS